MENKIKEKISKFISGDSKKIKIIVAVGLIGMVLILLSDVFPKSADKAEKTDSTKITYNDYTDQLELKLVDVISSISGVGECKVMITLVNSAESVYATNNEIKTDENSTNQKDEYVLYDASDGETPVLLKEYLPQVQGVTVVCSGRDDIVTKEKIIEAVTALFNIPANRVSVSKLK